LDFPSPRAQAQWMQNEPSLGRRTSRTCWWPASTSASPTWPAPPPSWWATARSTVWRWPPRRCSATDTGRARAASTSIIRRAARPGARDHPRRPRHGQPTADAEIRRGARL